jgi:hypothetical protein
MAPGPCKRAQTGYRALVERKEAAMRLSRFLAAPIVCSAYPGWRPPRLHP